MLTALLFRFANGWLCCIRGFSFLVHDDILSGKLVNFGDVSFFGLVPRGFRRESSRPSSTTLASDAILLAPCVVLG